MQAYYFGCVGGLGHRLLNQGYQGVHSLTVRLNDRSLDNDVYCGAAVLSDFRDGRWWWRGDTKHQPEGYAQLHHIDGYTLLGFWDRSVDSRFGSKSVFVIAGQLTAADAAARAREAFPAIWARYRFEVHLPATEAKP